MATTKKKASTEKITLVPLTDLYERADHPIKMRDDDSMQETVESVKQRGVLTPGIVRPRAEDGKKKEAADIVGEAAGESGRQVQCYIRLTELAPKIQQIKPEPPMAKRL